MSEDASIRAPMPENVTLEHEADGLRVSYRWFSPKYVLLLLFCAVWGSIVVVWYRTAFGSLAHDDIVRWFPLLHVAVGLHLAYATLAGFVNHTTVRATSSQLTVRHGPVPWFGGRTIPTSEIAQLYREAITSTLNDQTKTRYRLSAVLRDERKKKLLTCDSGDVALYIEQDVEHQLGIAARHVAGEMPK